MIDVHIKCVLLYCCSITDNVLLRATWFRDFVICQFPASLWYHDFIFVRSTKCKRHSVRICLHSAPTYDTISWSRDSGFKQYVIFSWPTVWARVFFFLSSRFPLAISWFPLRFRESPPPEIFSRLRDFPCDFAISLPSTKIVLAISLFPYYIPLCPEI